MKLAKAVLLTFLLLVVIVIGSWIVAVPEQSLIDLIENSLSAEALYLKVEGFKKGPFYSFSIDRAALFRKAQPGEGRDILPGKAEAPDRPLLTFEDINGRMNILSVLKLRPRLGLDCSLQGGRISGEVDLVGKSAMKMAGRDIRIKGLPFLEDFGIRGEGNLSGELRSAEGKGEMKIAIDDARLQSASFGGFFLPLEFFRSVRGLITVQGKTFLIQSLALQGDGIYARARGQMTGNDLSVGLEVMTDSSFPSGPVIETMLGRYKVSPGYYQMPIKTRLSP